MRYSEMQAFEKERVARRVRGGSSAPPDLIIGRLFWWPALLLVILCLILAGCASPQYRDTTVQMKTYGPVDLAQYEGLWYEIARFPNSFEEGCVGVTAEYSLNPDGTIKVVNTCRQGTMDGPVEVAEGVATVVSADGDKFEVSFVPWLPFAKGDYWILHIEPNYTVAVIGSPAGTTGWILSTAPVLPKNLMQIALAVLQENGYDTSKLYYTPQ